MKIAIIAPEFPPSTGGEQEYAAQVARELHHRGHQVVVFTRKGNVGRDEGYEVRDVLRGQQAYDRKIIHSFIDFDIIHVMNAAWSWLARFSKPTFLSIHGNDFVSPNPVYGYDLRTRFRLPKGDRVDFWLAVKRTRAMMKRCLPLCRTIFANSEYTKSLFLDRYPHCRGLVVKAGLGVSIGHRETVAASERNANRAKRILTVCRLCEPRKNVDLVLRALARLKSHWEFHYTVVGEGDLRNALERLAVALDVADRVSFVGRVNDARLKSYYRESDLFVMASGISDTSFEGFGIVYLEANSFGVPTMAVRVGGAQEAVREGLSGFFVEEATVEAIELGLHSFLSGERRFCFEECQKFSSEFTWARVIDRLEEHYVAHCVR